VFGLKLCNIKRLWLLVSAAAAAGKFEDLGPSIGLGVGGEGSGEYEDYSHHS